MITSYRDYKDCFEKERMDYKIKSFLLKDELYYISRYMKLLRKEEWIYNNANAVLKLYGLLIRRARGRLGAMLGFLVPINVVGEGCKVWHSGGLIINARATIGRDCVFHGHNCVGNNGHSVEAPVIGDRVEFGFGAMVIGDVFIADDCKVGAGAVVTKSCYDKGAVLIGVPAKKKG